MFLLLKDVFNAHLPNLVVDAKFFETIRRFRLEFMHKNQDHMEFFGGNLLGSHIVRFSDKDFDVFFNDILQVDKDVLEAALHSADAINPKWKISSDVFNITLTYLIHRALTSKLPTKQQQALAIELATLFNYRCIAALTAWYFKYPIDKRLAEMTYSVLTQRYLIKRLGSWQQVLEYRALKMVEPSSIHHKNLIAYQNDVKIIYFMNDSQGRIKDMIKNIYAEFIRVHRSGERISTQSGLTLDSEGFEIIRDKQGGVEQYIEYLLQLLPDVHAFVKEELIDIVQKTLPTASRTSFRRTLEWCSKECLSQDYMAIEQFIKLTMTYGFQYLIENQYLLKNQQDLVGLLSKLRNVFISSRAQDTDLIEIRRLGDTIVRKAVGRLNQQATSSIRLSLTLYLALRAYTRQHYTQGH